MTAAIRGRAPDPTTASSVSASSIEPVARGRVDANVFDPHLGAAHRLLGKGGIDRIVLL